jgi:hypothetical protein
MRAAAARSEVRANAFEAWAFSYWLRGRMPEYYEGCPMMNGSGRPFTAATWGLRIARKGRISADRMNPILRQRLNERSDSQKTFDAARMMITGGWRCLAAAVVWCANGFRPDAPSTSACTKMAAVNK